MVATEPFYYYILKLSGKALISEPSERNAKRSGVKTLRPEGVYTCLAQHSWER